MPREPRTSPVLPSYGASSLADLSASLLASLTGDETGNVLRLPEAERACLLVIDGLGLEQLRAHQAAAPFLAELAFNAPPLTAGFPATTVTSLGSFGTGVPPGSHGLLGTRVAVPGEDRLMNGLHWPKDIDPVAWQPRETIFERARSAGVRPVQVAPGPFAGNGLNEAALRGADFHPAWSMGALAAVTVAALNDAERTLVTAYHGDLDGVGHEFGPSSAAWANQLSHVDRLAEQIAAGLPLGGVLYVTADHGMVSVGPDDRFDFDDPESPLRDGVTFIGGETRARYVYARPGAAADVLATWQEVLGDRFWVVSREEAVKDGWFGPPGEALSEAHAARLGDVIAAATGTSAVVASSAEPVESRMVGMHGSLTTAEQFVPLLTFTAR